MLVRLVFDAILEEAVSVVTSQSSSWTCRLTAPYFETCRTKREASLNSGSATIFPPNPEELLGTLVSLLDREDISTRLLVSYNLRRLHCSPKSRCSKVVGSA